MTSIYEHVINDWQNGTDTILSVEYEIIPGEQRTHDYPGSESHISIIKATDSETGTEIELNDHENEDIVESIMKMLGE